LEGGQSAVGSRILSRDIAVSGGLDEGTADGPPRGAGRSAGRIRNLSRGVVASGGFAELNCGQSAILERTVRRIDLKLSREAVGSGGSAKQNCERSALWLRTVRRTFQFGYSDYIV